MDFAAAFSDLENRTAPIVARALFDAAPVADDALDFGVSAMTAPTGEPEDRNVRAARIDARREADRRSPRRVTIDALRNEILSLEHCIADARDEEANGRARKLTTQRNKLRRQLAAAGAL